MYAKKLFVEKIQFLRKNRRLVKDYIIHRSISHCNSLIVTRYCSMKHLHATTNKVERLFSSAKIVMTDLRKSMTPWHLELLMILHMNRRLWNEKTVPSGINCNN